MFYSGLVYSAEFILSLYQWPTWDIRTALTIQQVIFLFVLEIFSPKKYIEVLVVFVVLVFYYRILDFNTKLKFFESYKNKMTLDQLTLFLNEKMSSYIFIL